MAKRQLQRLLDEEFPEVEARVHEPEPLFPEYSEARPAGAWLSCPRVGTRRRWMACHLAAWDELPTAECNTGCARYTTSSGGNDALTTRMTMCRLRKKTIEAGPTWKACRDARWLYLGVCCEAGDLGRFLGNAVQVMVGGSGRSPAGSSW